jgi:hypothetical protein
MSNLITFLIIGLVFSPFAGIMAGLITYEEYAHHYSGNKEPLHEALRTGVFAFLVFMGLSFLAGLFLGYFIKP